MFICTQFLYRYNTSNNNSKMYDLLELIVFELAAPERKKFDNEQSLESITESMRCYKTKVKKR